jgi:hypothetical protein
VSGSPSNWTAALTKAVGTLVVVALVLFIVEPIFMHVLPGLLVLLLLIGIYRVAIGGFRRGGW